MKKNTMLRIWIAVLSLVLCGGACTKQAPEYAQIEAKNGLVRIPVSLVHDGNAHFYTYKLEGKNVNFFVRTDIKGRLRTHFDACYTCYKYKMGYVQEGREVVCRACRIGFNLDEEVWDYVGACVPISLSSTVRDGHIEIKCPDLKKGLRLF